MDGLNLKSFCNFKATQVKQKNVKTFFLINLKVLTLTYLNLSNVHIFKRTYMLKYLHALVLT